VATAGDQIERAMRLLGILADGETPSANEYADGLESLNQMLDSWSTERLAVYSTQDQSFTWTAGQASRTLGASGNFVGTRPIHVDPATYYTLNGVSYPLQLINREQYSDITLKTVTSTLPEVMYVNMTDPNITMYLYPVPVSDIAIHVISVVPLSQAANTSTTLAFPPGYLRAFAYNLALEIAPEYGIKPSEDVRRVAMVSKRNLKRINNPGDVLTMPQFLAGNIYGGNVYSGWY